VDGERVSGRGWYPMADDAPVPYGRCSLVQYRPTDDRWGPVALPGPHGVWWAYVVGPFLGGPIGATLYDLTIRATPAAEEQGVVYEDTPA